MVRQPWNLGNMADINWVNGPGTTYTYEMSSLTPAVGSATTNSHDENDATFYAQNGFGYPPAWVYGHMLVKATFAKPITMISIRALHAEGAVWTTSGGGSQDWILQYQIGEGGWSTQGSGVQLTAWDAPRNDSYAGLKIKDVTAVQVHTNISWVNYHMFPFVPGFAWQYIYELSAFGHLETSSTIFFGCNT